MMTNSGHFAVCVRDRSDEPQLDETFARCAAFALFTATGTLAGVVENGARDAAGAASTQATEQLRGLGVVAVAAARFGPNALRVLNAAGIRTYRCDEPIAAREAWRRASDGALPSG
jgi:predicted Fe-Mo cluster-binding NifX family protein